MCSAAPGSYFTKPATLPIVGPAARNFDRAGCTRSNWWKGFGVDRPLWIAFNLDICPHAEGRSSGVYHVSNTRHLLPIDNLICLSRQGGPDPPAVQMYAVEGRLRLLGVRTPGHLIDPLDYLRLRFGKMKA